jgi:hypothetical protein
MAASKFETAIREQEGGTKETGDHGIPKVAAVAEEMKERALN